MNLDELNERYKLQKSLANSYNRILKLFIDKPQLLEKLRKKIFIEKILDSESIVSIFNKETTFEKADKLIETILLSKLEIMKDFMEFYDHYYLVSEKEELNREGVVITQNDKKEEPKESERILYQK